MSRSEQIRQAALKRDGYRCQITGRAGPQAGGDSPLEVDHWKGLGMGGSTERDIIQNMITLYAPIHHLKTEKKFFIEKWDPDNGVLEIGDETHHIITHDSKALKRLFGIERLWFYSKQEVERLQPIAARIQGLHMIDGQVARDLFEIYRDDNYKLLAPEALSFNDYAAAQGWDLKRARRLISLWKKSQELGIEWPAGMSAPDFKRQLQNAGEIKPQSYWYIVFEPLTETERIIAENRPHDPLKIIRTDDPDALAGSLSPYQVAARVGKWLGMHVKDGKLLDRSQQEIPYETM